jgi:uncharacterized membrane protein YdfJ with MMPL/SSD domain
VYSTVLVIGPDVAVEVLLLLLLLLLPSLLLLLLRRRLSGREASGFPISIGYYCGISMRRERERERRKGRKIVSVFLGLPMRIHTILLRYVVVVFLVDVISCLQYPCQKSSEKTLLPCFFVHVRADNCAFSPVLV